MQLLTTAQVADKFGLSSVTIIRLADAGTLPAIEVARRKNRRILRFDPEAIGKFIAARTTAGAK